MESIPVVSRAKLRLEIKACELDWRIWEGAQRGALQFLQLDSCRRWLEDAGIDQLL